MTTAGRRFTGITLALLMIFTAAAASVTDSYAEEPPVIVFSEPDHKLAPGEGMKVGLTLSAAADNVVLENWDKDKSEWQTCGDCVSMDPGNTIWTYDLPALPDSAEGLIRFRFAIRYGDGESSIYSPEFTIEWAEGAVLIPEILYCSCDHWLWPGEQFTVGVVTTAGAKGAILEYYNEESGEWLKYGDCSQNEADGSWYYDLPPYPGGGEGTIRFRIAVLYGAGTEPPVLTEEFTMYWTLEQGYERIAGENRYDTALRIAEEKRKLSGSEEYENVIITCGTEFADALGGTYLAAVKNAPILLVNSNPDVIRQVAGNVRQYLSAGGKAYILGGFGAVPQAVEAALEEEGIGEGRIERFAGTDRYDTNLKILDCCEPKGRDLLICCGTDFADALSASSVGKPILLAGKTLKKEQADFITRNAPGNIYIIGGAGAVSEAVEDSVNDLGYTAIRIWGNNRYETSALVATEFFSEKQRHYVTLAYGLDFPDGLAGGPLCLELDPEAPLLLVKEGASGPAEAYVRYNGRTRRAKVLGGPALIPDALAEKIVYTRAAG